MATDFPSYKPFKQNNQDMLATAGDVKTNT